MKKVFVGGAIGMALGIAGTILVQRNKEKITESYKKAQEFVAEKFSAKEESPKEEGTKDDEKDHPSA